MDIGKQIRIARKANGLTLEALANQVETDTGNLSRLERGLQGASQDLLQKIMAALNLKLVDGGEQRFGLAPSLIGALDRPENGVGLSENQQRARNTYPLISWDAAGTWPQSSNHIQLDDTRMLLATTEDAGENGFWMDVRGDFMTCDGNPSFPEGSRILVRPNAEIVSGKYYVVLLEGNELTFRQYVEDAGSKYLRPLNKNYRTREINDSCRFIGRVIDAKMTGL